MLALDLEDAGANKMETRTGIRTYRWGKTRTVSVVHRFAEGRTSLMTGRVASLLIRRVSHICDNAPVSASQRQQPQVPTALTIRESTKTSTFFPFASLRSRLDFLSRHVSKRWGKALPSGRCESGPRISLVARFPRVLNANERR